MTSVITTLPVEIQDLLTLVSEINSVQEYQDILEENPLIDKSLTSVFTSPEHYQFMAHLHGDVWFFNLENEYDSWSVQNLGAPEVNYNEGLAFPGDSPAYGDRESFLLVFKFLLGEGVTIVETDNGTTSIFEYACRTQLEDLWREAWDQFILSKYPGFGSYFIQGRSATTITTTVYIS